jgi:plastocyanin
MKTRIALVSAVTLALVACGGGGGSSYSSPTGTTGTIGTTGSVPANTIEATDGLVFNPTTLTVTKGTVVTFTFGTVQHTVVFNAVSGAPANIPPSSPNTSVPLTFGTSGAFAFHCSIHSYMTGQITVQ